MTRNEIIAFINENPVFSLGTSEGEQPRVRLIMTYRADESGIIFITGTKKDMNQQLLRNPRVELCYYEPKNNVQLRITGSLKELEDDSLKEEIIEKFSFLKPFKEKQGLSGFTVWSLPGGVATRWDMESAFERKTFFDF